MYRRQPREREASMSRVTSMFIPVFIFAVMLLVVYQGICTTALA